MAVSTPNHLLHVFLSQLPMLATVAPSRTSNLTARLTSLLEVTIEAIPFGEYPVPEAFSHYHTTKTLQLEVEPTVISLGSRFLAVGMNNHAWFYELTNTGIEKITEYDYVNVIDKICVNDAYCAAKSPTGQLTLHWIDPKTLPTRENDDRDTEMINSITSREQRMFIEPHMNGVLITDFHLTNSFLIYATNSGCLVYFTLDDWEQLSEFQHCTGIVSIFPNCTGTRVAFIDDQLEAFIYNPALNSITQIPEFSATANRFLWDLEENENSVLLVACEDTRLSVYRYHNHGRLLTHTTKAQTSHGDASKSKTGIRDRGPSMEGQSISSELLSGHCRYLGNTRLPYGHLPLAVSAGELCLLSSTGRLTNQLMSTHAFRAITSAVLVRPDESADVGNGTSQSTKEGGGTTEKPGKKSGSTTKRSAKRDQGSVVDLNKLTHNELQTFFDQALRAGCFEDASVFAERLDNSRLWNQLGMSCLRAMHFDLAIRAFRMSHHPGLVISVQRIQGIEDEFLLQGYVAMLLKEFDQAQELFLASSKPLAALEMRRDLLHWDTALQLARTMSPGEIPIICREYALEMECIGDYVNALMHFERGLNPPELHECDSSLSDQCDVTLDEYNTRLSFDHGERINSRNESTLKQSDVAWEQQVQLCQAGIARNALRLGDFTRGVQLAKQSGNTSLQRTCADILEQMKQWPDAASLYELCGCFEAAVTVHLRCKNYKRAGELLGQVTNAPRLHLQYAKARESESSFKEAVIAYEAAHDWDSVVRLQLDVLSNPDEAIRVVRETKSIEGAKMIAKYFTRINDYSSAIQFLVMSQCSDTAFELARKHRKMELYAEAIGTEASISEYQSIASHFESEKNCYLAGKYFLMAKQYEKAVRHLLRVPYAENSPALDLALEAVGLAGDSRLTHLLIVYLMGESDGVPKDARHLFRLYMVLKQYKEAARTAVIIAREEQTSGNYRNAHDLLFGLVQELRQRDLRVPSEMADNLALLHSYILAKVHVKHGDHLRAARMLIRVAENISKFPSHVIQILTSTVIECQRAGLKSASFGYAAMLLRPDYRDKLDPKHRRKFETLVRRPDHRKTNEASGDQDQESSGIEVDPVSPCPSCAIPLAGSSLYCTECRSTLPYCIITGNHVNKNDFTVCPSCQFPAIYSEMMRFIENKDPVTCPMCSTTLMRDAIRRMADPSKIIHAWVTTEDSTAEVRSDGVDETTDV